MVNAYSNNYLESQIKSASPEQLLVMFYDGAIRFGNQAIKAIEDRNIEKRNYSINKACAIITELNATLDHNIGGEIAKDLNRLYDYMLRELHQANSSNNTRKIEVVVQLLSELRDTWKKAIDIKKSSTSTRNASEQQYRSISTSF